MSNEHKRLPMEQEQSCTLAVDEILFGCDIYDTEEHHSDNHVHSLNSIALVKQHPDTKFA